jgi:hypothetical protein
MLLVLVRERQGLVLEKDRDDLRHEVNPYVLVLEGGEVN